MTASGAPARQSARYAPGVRGNFDLVLATFCGLLLISNVGATKAIAFPLPFSIPLVGDRLITDGGAFLFPLTYVLGDVLAEVYGLRRARRAIVLAFGMAALASLVFLLVSVAPPAPGWPNQDAWLAVLGFFPRVVLASLCGFLAGQFLNAYVLVKIKARTLEGSMWARLLGSSVVGELADTVLFCVIAFAGILSWPDLLRYTATGYVYKVLVEVACLPVTYAMIGVIKRHEPGYDRGAPQEQQKPTTAR